MNCPGCGNELRRHERAQPMHVLGAAIRPASFCDACCHAGLWAPGTPDALKRLAAGHLDPAEQIRVEEMTRLSFGDALDQANQTAGGRFVIPESAR